MNIAIIPARQGSKRLPKKNIMPFKNKPLIHWTIDAAIKSNQFSNIHVDTDCEKIAHVAVNSGAHIPFIRPKHLARDSSTTNEVIANHYDFLIKNFENFESICILQPTSPLRSYQHIRDAYKVFNEKNADSVISVCEIECKNELINKINEDGTMNKFYNQNSKKNTKYHRINGSIYILRKYLGGNLNNMYGKKSYPFLMERKHSVDIDTISDFELAEFYFFKK